MKLTRTTAGVYAIAPTPFHDDGRVDWESWESLHQFYSRVGLNGVTVLGQLGESQKLTSDESRNLVRTALAASGLPIVVGISTTGFASMGELADYAMAEGAAGVMVAPDRALRTDDSIVRYFAQVGRTVGGETPWVLQDYPLTFTVVMTPVVIARIARENANCVMLKHEDWPGLEKLTAIRALETRGEMPRLAILCGNGGLFLDYELSRGADGAMTGYSYPEMLVELVALHQRGERERMLDLFDAHLPFLRYEHQQGEGLAVRKYAMARRGIIGGSALRSPGPVLSATSRAEINELITRLDARLAN